MIWIDIDMPKNCRDCPLHDVDEEQCPIYSIYKADYDKSRFDKCPLHEFTTDPDTISRKQAIDALEFDYAYAAAKIIKALPPSPTPNRPHGQWIFSQDDSEGTCTNCQYKIYGWKYRGHYMILPYNFCPNCGADMRQHEQISSLETPCDDCNFADRCTYESNCPRGTIWEAEHEYDE